MTAALTEPAADAAIGAACHTLHLPTVRAQAGELADAAARDRLTHRAYLAELLSAETDQRDARRRERRIREARFPRVKRLDAFDLAAAPGVAPATLATLAAGTWTGHGQPLVLLGDSGTGKTHLLTGAGTAACEQGRSVRYTTCAALVNELARGRRRAHPCQDDRPLRTARPAVLRRARLPAPGPPRRGAAVPGHHRTRRKSLHRRGEQRAVLRVGPDLHRPPPSRRRRRPAHLQRPHHPDRHRLLPAARHPGPEAGDPRWVTMA